METERCRQDFRGQKIKAKPVKQPPETKAVGRILLREAEAARPMQAPTGETRSAQKTPQAANPADRRPDEVKKAGRSALPREEKATADTLKRRDARDHGL